MQPVKHFLSSLFSNFEVNRNTTFQRCSGNLFSSKTCATYVAAHGINVILVGTRPDKFRYYKFLQL